MKILITENRKKEVIFKYLDQQLGYLREEYVDRNENKIKYGGYLLFVHGKVENGDYNILYYDNKFAASFRSIFGLDDVSLEYYIKDWFETRNGVSVTEML